VLPVLLQQLLLLPLLLLLLAPCLLQPAPNHNSSRPHHHQQQQQQQQACQPGTLPVRLTCHPSCWQQWHFTHPACSGHCQSLCYADSNSSSYSGRGVLCRTSEFHYSSSRHPHQGTCC
jgi:hypothetical protein